MSTTRSPRRFLVVFLAGALFLSGCELLEDSDVRQVKGEIKDSTGVDVDSPTAVGGALLGSQYIGDKDSTDGLTVIRAAQRVQHERAGDVALARGDYNNAEQQYQQAIDWGGDDQTMIRERRRLSDAYDRQAQYVGGTPAQSLYNQAGDQDMARARLPDRDGPRYQGFAYLDAAKHYTAGGNPSAACAALANARAVPASAQTEYYRDDVDWSVSQLAATGYTCNGNQAVHR